MANKRIVGKICTQVVLNVLPTKKGRKKDTDIIMYLRHIFNCKQPKRFLVMTIRSCNIALQKQPDLEAEHGFIYLQYQQRKISWPASLCNRSTDWNSECFNVNHSSSVFNMKDR